VGEAGGNKHPNRAKISPARHRPYIIMIAQIPPHVGATAGGKLSSDATIPYYRPPRPYIIINFLVLFIV